MKKLLTFSLCLFGVCANAQQAISDWKYQKDMSSNPQNFIKAGKKIYFVATTPEHGRELWVTEGTTESTKLVKDIMVGENNAFGDPANVLPTDYAYYNFLSNVAPLEDGTLYFVASDNPNEKPKIWVTDGTEKGTKMYQNEVKGTLFYTGDELVEYKIDLPNDIIKIFHQDAKKDSLLTLGYGKNIISPNTNYVPGMLKKNNFLTISVLFTSQYEPPSYIVTVDLKKQKVIAKSPQKQGFSILTRWQNSIYWFISYTQIGRINQITGKYDTLSIATNKKYGIGDVVRVHTTLNDFFLVINNDIYSVQNNQFIVKNDVAFQNFFGDGQYNNFTSSYYDIKNDILYSYRNNETDKKLFIKGIRLSDSKVVKDFSIPSVRYASNLSSTKLFISSSVEPYQSKVLDVTQEKLIDLPYFIDYYLYPFKSGESTFFGTYPINSASIDKELYVLDSQTDEIKLLKNINTTGISVPKVYTTIFNGKMVQVYSNEKGVMLGVSDGTRTGTKDLKLLIKTNNVVDFRSVLFKEKNQRLGLLITTKNITDSSKDSLFFFSINSKMDNINLLFSEKDNSSYSGNDDRINEVKDNKNRVSINSYTNKSSRTCITDLTVEGTLLFNKKSSSYAYVPLSTDKYMFIQAKFYDESTVFAENYLLRYDLQTFKIDTISKTEDYANFMKFEDKNFCYSAKSRKWNLIDGVNFTEIPGVSNIQDIFKINDKTFIADNGKRIVAYPYENYKFSILQLENNTTKEIYSIDIRTDYSNSYSVSYKLWKFNGKTYLILNLPILDDKKFEWQTHFYEIKADLSFVKVYQVNNDKSSNLTFLSKGLTYSEIKNDDYIIYAMKDDFKPKEIYRLKVDTYSNYSNYLSSDSLNLKSYLFRPSGLLFVTDGSAEGSKLLIDKKIKGVITYDIVKVYQYLNVSKDKFFFSFLPASVHGANLWVTDGTEKGTVQLMQGNAVDYYYNYENDYLGVIDKKFIFKKPNEDIGKYEMWVTEGTIETTRKMLDNEGKIVTDNRNRNFIQSWQNLPKINNKLYFSRQTEKNGYEPWVTDGTPEGTKMVGDLVKGIQSSNPYQFVEINQNPYCIATEENKSLQLWAFCSNNLKPVIDVEKLSNLNVESVKLLTNQNNDLKYQWIKDGKPVENATLPTLTTQTSGTYQVKIEDKIGCANISDSVVVKILQKVLANEPITDDFSLNIYPNPTQGDLNVSFENTSQGNFEAIIYDIYGKVVSQQTIFPNINNTIATKNLTAGTYIFRLSNGEKQSFRKVIKQ